MSFKDKPCWFGGSSSTHKVTCGFGNVSWKRSNYFDKISSQEPQVCLAFTFGSMCVLCFYIDLILLLFLGIHGWLPSCLILVSSKPQFPINLGVCGCAQLHWPRKNYFKIDHCQDNCQFQNGPLPSYHIYEKGIFFLLKSTQELEGGNKTFSGW